MKHALPFILALSCLTFAGEPTVTPGEATLLKELQALPPQAAASKLSAALAPDSSPALHFALASLLLRDNRPQQAIPPLRQALKAQPDFHRARLLLAQTHAQLQDFSACAGELTTLLQHPTAPKSHETWALLAQAHARRNLPLPAENAIRNAIALSPENLDYQRLLLSLLISQKQADQAASLARQLLPQDHHRELTWIALVNPPLQRHQLEEASQLLTIACTAIPDSHKLLQLHASVLLQLRQHAPAAAILHTLQARHGLPIPLALTGAQALLSAGHPEDARQILAGIPKDNLTPGQCLDYRRVLVQTKLNGSPRHDLPLWQELLSRNPHDTHALLAIARLHHQLNQNQDAIRILNKLLRLAPDTFDAHILMANAHLAENRQEEALAALRKAYRIFPSPQLDHAIRQLAPQPPRP